jgi:DNA-binding response OmpR family regulator
MLNRLRGRSILVIEHELNVARELEQQFKKAGATVYSAGGLRDALHMAEHPALSAAVINLRLGNDKTTAVCRRLEHLGIPFMFYTRYDPADEAHQFPGAPVVFKPAETHVVARTVAGLVN